MTIVDLPSEDGLCTLTSEFSPPPPVPKGDNDNERSTWCADKMPSGNVVHYANGQALVYMS